MLLALFITVASVSVSGRVVDAETQTPIAGARVVIAPADAASPPGATSLDEVVTDKEGRFIFAAVEPGRYRLDALKKGFAPLVNPSTSTAVVVDVAETPVDGLELAMTRGGAISGRIVETTGTPRPRLVVSALKVSDAPPDSSASVTAKTAETDEEGAFFLQDLPEGSYLVMAAPQPSSSLPPTDPPVDASLLKALFTSAPTIAIRRYVPETTPSSRNNP